MNTLGHNTIPLQWYFARIIGDVLVIFSAFMGWFWPTVVLALLLVFTVRAYEVLVATVILDSVLAPITGLPVGDFLSTSILLCASTLALYLFRITRYIPFM